MPSAEHTVSAASRSNPPVNTPSRSNSCRSAGPSRSYDQSTAARSVWCRSTAVRSPPVSRRNRWSKRRANSSGVRTPSRAAASSMASGNPSRRRHSLTTAAVFSASSTKSGRTARPRSTNSRTASLLPIASTSPSSSGTSRATTITICSPGTFNPSRLVASTRTPGQVSSMFRTSDATGRLRCSQLSSTSSSSFARRNSSSVSVTLMPSRGDNANAPASASGTPSTSRTPASSHHQAPSRYPGAATAALWSPRRVLPTPPTPTNVTTRADASASTTSTRSASRPTNELSAVGRLPRETLDATSGPNSRTSPRPHSW